MMMAQEQQQKAAETTQQKALSLSVMDEKTEVDDSKVKVAIRIRPLCAREKLAGGEEVLMVSSDGRTVCAGPEQTFTFDSSYDTKSSQHLIWKEQVLPLLNKAIDGYNSTILAYGQTGSGKTFTMGTGGGLIDFKNNGDDYGDGDGDGDSIVGIVPRSAFYLFEELGRRENGFSIFCSFLELYNEELVDLLAGGSVGGNSSSVDRVSTTTNTTNTSARGKKSNRKSANNPKSTTVPLTIREEGKGQIVVTGLTEVEVHRPKDLLDRLEKGSLSRTTKSTEMNAVSSRSHAIFTVMIKQSRGDSDGFIISKIHFVDLAGSERLKRTGASGQRAKESISINGGLSALGNVIGALSQERPGAHIPYRNSKLTRLLQDSLGGNSKTVMLACVSPSNTDWNETINTLKYAHRTREIKNKARMNSMIEGGNDAFELMQLRKQVSSLRQQVLHLKASSPSSSRFSELLHSHQILKDNFIKVEAERDFYKTGGGGGICFGDSDNNQEQLSLIQSYLGTISKLRDELEDVTSKSAFQNQNQMIAMPDVQELQIEMLSLKEKYEERLRLMAENVKSITKERDQALTRNPQKKVMDWRSNRLEDKLQAMGREINFLKAKLATQNKDQSLKAVQGDASIRSLKQTIQSLKAENQRILQSTSVATATATKNNVESIELREARGREHKSTELAKKYKKAYDFQKSLLTKRIEQYMTAKANVKILIQFLKRKRIPLTASISKIVCDSSNSPRSLTTTATITASTISSLSRIPSSSLEEDGDGDIDIDTDGDDVIRSIRISDDDNDDEEELVNEARRMSISSENLPQTPSKSPLHRRRRKDDCCPTSPTLTSRHGGSEVPRSALKGSPLTPKRKDIFARFADAASLSLATHKMKRDNLLHRYEQHGEDGASSEDDDVEMGDLGQYLSSQYDDDNPMMK